MASQRKAEKPRIESNRYKNNVNACIVSTKIEKNKQHNDVGLHASVFSFLFSTLLSFCAGGYTHDKLSLENNIISTIAYNKHISLEKE